MNQIVARNQTALSITSDANPAAYGQAITFTASVAGAYGLIPTGQVEFFVDGNYIGEEMLAHDGTGRRPCSPRTRPRRS